MTDLASRVKPFGLTQVYCSEKPQVDVVLVHGLNGHPYNTWATQSGVYWPAHLLPEFLQSSPLRILTYGYNANVHSFTDGVSKDRLHNHAETLTSSLAANRNLRGCSDRPIIFVCHSLGGLIVKRALIYCNSVQNERIEHLRSIFVSTYGMLFLGTPHNGSDIAKWGALLQNICTAVMPKKFLDSSPQLVKALRSNNETLQNINSLFADIMPRFHIYFFHETLPTDLRGSREMIVDESSAAPYVEGVERMGIESDHRHMCKFEDDTAPGFEAVAEALLRYSRDAPRTVTDRWVEENRMRALKKHTKAREIFGNVEGHSMAESEPDLRSHGNPAPLQQQLTHTDQDRRRSLAGGESLSSSHTSQREQQLFVAPPGFHPNANFVGFQKELELLHTRVFKSKKRPDRLVAVLICGGPGSGKSHLARQYVFKQHKNYPGGIFWVDAKSHESACKCFWDIAQTATLTDGQEFKNPDSKAPQKYVETVRNWFQAREDWLLVFDGVSFRNDDELNQFRQFLPFKKNCSIIYTSVDRTLRKKQRLYEPYCLQVPPLQVEDACKLLFKDLLIKKPTQEQIRRATDLVRYYECLPLAIHAISHRLSVTEKPIEKYHVDSRLTDEKLAEPFLVLMHDLYQMGHLEALNLINILSFFDHNVPVGLINLGRSSLVSSNVEILAKTRPGEPGDIDTTLGILIRYGLIERTINAYELQAQALSPVSERSHILDAKAVIPDLSESQTESSQEAFFAPYQYSGSIDMIKIHSVVQSFCRDELTIMDEERNSKPCLTDPSKSEAGYFDSWLVIATNLLCTSYGHAKRRMEDIDDHGLVKDYREYETHASRLAEFFPKKMSKKPSVVHEAFDDLKQVLRSISNEIERISPTSSQESIRRQRSVFDRSSSSSSSVPNSATEDGPSRHLTWDFSDMEQPRADSPEEMPTQPRFHLEPIVPRIFRECSFDPENGYETDGEGPKGMTRNSPIPSLVSHTTATERPLSSQASSPPRSEELGWHIVQRSVKHRQAKEQWPKKRPQRPKFPRNIRGSKLAAPKVAALSVEGRSASSSPLTKSRSSSGVSASAALAAVHQGSPPPTRRLLGDQLVSDKENLPTYAAIAAQRTQGMGGVSSAKQRSSSSPGGKYRPKFLGLNNKSSGDSLQSRSSNAHASPLSAEFRHGPMSQSTYSETDQTYLTNQLNALDLQTQDAEWQRPRHLSASRPVDMSASTPSVFTYMPQLPVDNNIEVTMSRRMGAVRPQQPQPISQSTTKSAVTHPSAFMPGISPPPSVQLDGPGYLSDPIPEPMTRDPSGQSHQSWATEPVRYPPNSSSLMPPTAQAAFPAGLTHVIPQQHTLSGTGSWISDTSQHLPPPPGTTAVPMASAVQAESMFIAAQGQPIQPLDEHMLSVDAHTGWAAADPASAQLLHFGGHRVDVRSARQRLGGYGQYQVQVPPQHVPMYRLRQGNHSGPVLPQGLGLLQPQDLVHGMTRPRSGSSPPRPGFEYDGLGVNFG
ncbi:catalytic protein [Aspergillus campestris IBT 28561]|uniref:Catalytic protein n=1 Tax=Aspergillus campestris (strain IBT 28561) TaxID=1392248 RepID=A0A2I1DER2_ASPC2|nr:catalytic protein [Aspergillus campestris IBT 28561]PKY08373.1 catalytic protein [Aspergillus campestris IBT 28561]